MTSRRAFLAATVAAPLMGVIRVTKGHAAPFDPWIEIDPEALRFNARQLSKLSGGRPMLAVIKNNGYGLGLVEVARILEPLDIIDGFAVVKLAAAHALRDAGVTKPVLHMGLAEQGELNDMVGRDISPAFYTDDAPRLAARAVAATGRLITPHLYIDTGMGRLGMPSYRAADWISAMVSIPGVQVQGMFMGFTEDNDFDRVQLARFLELRAALDARGAAAGRIHAASSDAVFNMPSAHLDLVRPGISLFGAYPSNAGVERSIQELRPAFSLKARVVRVEQLRVGDGVSYGRNWVAERPTWTATLPIGHSDGYSREAVKGAVVLINGELFPVIGAVSASHTIVELGDEPKAAIGDEATLLGPGAPEIHPNDHAHRIGRSVYDVLMHLSPSLPRRVLG